MNEWLNDVYMQEIANSSHETNFVFDNMEMVRSELQLFKSFIQVRRLKTENDMVVIKDIIVRISAFLDQFTNADVSKN